MSSIKNEAKIRNPLIVAIREQPWMYPLSGKAAVTASYCGAW